MGTKTVDGTSTGEDNATLGTRGGTGAEQGGASGGAERSEASEPPRVPSNRRYATAGGRVLMVVASGADLKEARDKALEAVRRIKCENLFYRTDIGHWVL